ncbi:hypothetical protein Tco_0451871 [Tanacetum coccineum]
MKASPRMERSVNNEVPVIDVNPLNSSPPSHVAENVKDSDDVSSEKGVVDETERLRKSSKGAGKRKLVIGPSIKEARRKIRKVPPQASKVFGDASDPLDVDSDPDIHEFPQSARETKDYGLICNATFVVIPLAVLDNMEVEKDKAYAELERKCNEALQDLDKNPLVLLIEEKKWINYNQTLSILRSKLEGLESEREKLKGFETQLLQEIDKLRQDRAAVVTKCIAVKEVAAWKEPFTLEKMHGYRSSSQK